MMSRRAMLMMLTEEQGGLPADYLQVEYLESTGTQYIDTGYYPNINTEFYSDFSDFSRTDGYFTPGGVSLTGSQVGLYSNNKGKTVYTAFGNKTDVQYTADTGQWLNRTKVIISKTGVVQDGVEKLTYSNVTFGSSPYSFVLFARRNGTSGDAERFAYMKLYESIISESGNEIRHFIPCIRISDSKPGMYDLVSRTFFTNAGTGEFIAGLAPQLSDTDYWSINGYMNASGSIISNNNYRMCDYKPSTAETNYTLTTNVNAWKGIGFYDSSKQPLGFKEVSGASNTLYAPEGTAFYRIYVMKKAEVEWVKYELGS